MNSIQDPLLTELSSTSSPPHHYYKTQLQLLLKQNTEYRQKCESLSILNLTLKQAMLNISKRGNIDPRIIQQIKQLSNKTDEQSKCQELREYYEREIKQVKERHRREIEELDLKFDEELEVRRKELEREYKERLSHERGEMVEELRKYLNEEKEKIEKQLMGKKSKESSIKSSRVKGTSFVGLKNNKSLKSPKVSFADESIKENFRTNLEQQKTITTQMSTARHKKMLLKEKSQEKLNSKIHHERKLSATTTYISSKPVSPFSQDEETKYVRAGEDKSKLLRELVKRKEEIEVELEKMVARGGGKQKGREKERERQMESTLETDLDEIVYVINNNGDLTIAEIEEILYGERADVEPRRFQKEGVRTKWKGVEAEKFR